MKRYVNFLALMVFLPMSYASDDDDDASSATLVEQEVIYACVKYDKKEGSLKKAVFFKVVVTVFSYSKLPSLLLAQAYPGSRILP